MTPPRRHASTRAWRKLRTACLDRDEHQCLRCGSAEKLEAAHVVPWAQGGEDMLDNLVTLCEDCHKKADARLFAAAGRLGGRSRGQGREFLRGHTGRPVSPLRFSPRVNLREIQGSRRPAHKRVPPAQDRSAGREAIELMRSLDMELDPWQQDILLAGMGRDRAGRWTSDEVAEIIPRQNGKTPPLFARLLWGLTMGGERKALWSAHEFKTASESFLDLQGLCEHPKMADHQPKFRISNGKEGITFADGQRVQFIARSKTSGRGFGADLIILDEAFALTDHQMASLKPVMSARQAPQAWYASSAPQEESTVLRRICTAARKGEASRLCYLEWCASDDDDRSEPATWAAANPALGRRLTVRYTESELVSLAPEDFARERLGIWNAEGPVGIFAPGVWEACEDADVQPDTERGGAMAIDVSPDRSRAAITLARASGEGALLVEVLAAGESVSWVVDSAVDLNAEYRPEAVLVDGAGQAQTLIAPLERAGLAVTRTDSREMTAACGAFHDRVIQGRLIHRGQSELDGAVAAARRRDLGDAWAWSRRRSSGDISPLVAASLAVLGVERRMGMSLYEHKDLAVL